MKRSGRSNALIRIPSTSQSRLGLSLIVGFWHFLVQFAASFDEVDLGPGVLARVRATGMSIGDDSLVELVHLWRHGPFPDFLGTVEVGHIQEHIQADKGRSGAVVV
jgi:hypothetical protein